MSRLSDSQLVVLTAACQRADRCVFPVTAKLKGNAAGNVLKSLLKKDLIKEVRAKRDDTVWRHDEERGRMTLVATKAAFAALGIDPRDEAEDAEADAADEAPANVEAKPNSRPKYTQNQRAESSPHPRRQQASATHCDAAPGKGSDHRRDRRGLRRGSPTRCAVRSQVRSRRSSASMSHRRRTRSADASIGSLASRSCEWIVDSPSLPESRGTLGNVSTGQSPQPPEIVR